MSAPPDGAMIDGETRKRKPVDEGEACGTRRREAGEFSRDRAKCGAGPAVVSADDGCYRWSTLFDEMEAEQRRRILADQSSKPLVGERVLSSALLKDLPSCYHEEIQSICGEYPHLRRIRGDGNCFYRSFMFAYLEGVLLSPNAAEVGRILARIRDCKHNLQTLGYESYVYGVFFEEFHKLVQSVLPGSESSLTHHQLLTKSCDPAASDYAVMFLRYVAAGEILKRRKLYEKAISGCSLNQFVTQVERLGHDADHLEIKALSDALGIPLRIVKLEPSMRNQVYDFHGTSPGENSQSRANDVSNITLTLLNSQVHYQILYRKSSR